MSQGVPQQWSLLTSRVSIPPTRAQPVVRPRLLKRLDEGMMHKCVLICAPAGSGKTTLLAAWARSRRRQGTHVAWLSLDDGDNDPLRFWSYFVAALQTVQADIGSEILSLLHSSQLPPFETLLVMLTSVLSTLFGLFHLGTNMTGRDLGTALAFCIISQAVAGIGLAVIFLRTRNILACVLAHGMGDTFGIPLAKLLRPFLS